VQLVGVRSNRSAIGARVTVRYGNKQQAQQVTAQSSFYSVNDRRLHFGLGPETIAHISIRWPNGAIETIPNVAANQLVVVRESSGIIRQQRF
jgi:enediyne biosynthesis protein E4